MKKDAVQSFSINIKKYFLKVSITMLKRWIQSQNVESNVKNLDPELMGYRIFQFINN